jgi:hypothetical protein
MSGLPEEGGLSAGCFKETLFWIANWCRCWWLNRFDSFCFTRQENLMD